MKLIRTDFSILIEAEKNGLVSAMTSILQPNRKPLNEELSGYFRENMPKYEGMFDEDDCEDILCGINEFLEEEKIDKFKREIDFPYSEGSDLYLIPITDNLQLKLLVVDEYHGDGDYSKYIEMTYFVITEQATTEDVDQLISAVKRILDI